MTDFFKHFIHELELPLQNPVLIFSIILFIILLSPILLKRINIPGIIVLIISGVIVGPHGLNVLEKNSAVDLFSTIGLLYIMFIAGLELDMNDFMINRNKSLLFGFCTFIFPLIIGFPILYYLLNYDFNASFLTASMFSTHTLVAYPIVSKLGISKNQAVAITVGGTILTDTAVLLILAVIMGSNQGSLNQAFWIRLGVSLAIFSGIMFFLVPRIAKWFFRELESEKHSHYIFVLSVVFFSAFLAEVAGVEPIIGAFVAGLALNKLIPHSSALMNRIEFIGNSLFIPFFLISVGMLVDVSVILNGPSAIFIAATLTVVALLGKWVAAFITQLILRYNKNQRQLIFGLSSAHAAATLAVILVGYNADILDENILNGTVILILITCVVASFATEKAAKKIVIQTVDETASQATNHELANEHILLPIANVENIEKLLEFSIYIKDKKSANPISILSVVSNDEEAEANILKARNKLEEFVKQGSASETKINVIATIDHNRASGIARISKEIMADTIVLGWPHRTGLLNKLIGDKVDNLLESTDKAVFICHLVKPLVLHKKINVAIPPLSELEDGFKIWFIKITKLAQELSAPIRIFCNMVTKKAIEKLVEQVKPSSAINTNYFDDWDDFKELSKNVRDEDLFVIISARKGSASHLNSLEDLPHKLEKFFKKNSKLIIYPKLYGNNIQSLPYTETAIEPLSRGIQAFQKIGREIGKIIKKL